MIIIPFPKLPVSKTGKGDIKLLYGSLGNPLSPRRDNIWHKILAGHPRKEKEFFEFESKKRSIKTNVSTLL